jgi:PilZ domain-containing protein
MLSAGGEKRSVQRFPGSSIRALQVRVQATGEAFAASVWDFSVKGIGLLADRDFAPGTALAVETTSSRGKARTLPAEVRHSDVLHDERRLIGCCFLHTLTMEDLLALG